jgi:membrane dipeptidase
LNKGFQATGLFVTTATVILASSIVLAADADYAKAAQELVQKAMIVDTHIDAPYRIKMHWEDLSGKTQKGEFDWVQAREGGLDIPFLVVYTPPDTEDKGTSFQVANTLFDHIEALVGRAPEKFALARNATEAEQAFKEGKVGLAIGMENGSPIEGKLENVAYFKNRGASYISLSHGKANHLSDSSYDEERRWNGLSDFGREVIVEMNRVGIMVDLSHLSDDAAWEALEISKVPVIASHSSARHFTPDFERNLSDDMIKAVAEKGGVVQINFGSSFIKQEATQWYDDMGEAREAWMEEHDIAKDDPKRWEFGTSYREEHPFPYADLDDLVAHFKHVIDLVGVEHVGFGSDFDGVGDSLPEGMQGVADYPNLVEQLLALGLSEEDVAGIMGGNLLRVWNAADAYAAKVAAAP